MTRRILLATGWAHAPEALRPMTDAFPSGWEAVLCEAEHLPELLAASPEPLYLGGWSLGALVALQSALGSPERVRGLLLIAGMARFCRSDEHPSGVEAFALRAMRRQLTQDPRATLADFIARCARPHPPLQTEADLASALHQSATTRNWGLQKLATLDLTKCDLRAAPPTVLLTGAGDEIVPSGSSAWLAARLPHSLLREHPDAGHDLPRRHPSWCASQLDCLMELAP